MPLLKHAHTALACLLAVCPTLAQAIPGEDVRGAALYEVNSQASRVDILVFRAGILARLGQNHVMTSAALTGRVWIDAVPEKSRFAFSFPVSQLIVDDPAARRAAGSDFLPAISQADRDITREIMLNRGVLDAQDYPDITFEGVQVSGTTQVAQIVARLQIKDVRRDVPVSVDLRSDGSQLTASGEFDIRQSDFGIKPFRVALGAFAVQDRLHVKFTVVAERSA